MTVNRRRLEIQAAQIRFRAGRPLGKRLAAAKAGQARSQATGLKKNPSKSEGASRFT
jgi:hypothetical protein